MLYYRPLEFTVHQGGAGQVHRPILGKMDVAILQNREPGISNPSNHLRNMHLK
jgi:hypothetical protein